MDNPSSQRIMIMLDLLLDTRLATIRQHWGEQAAIEVFKNGYIFRTSDIFSVFCDKINDAEYKKHYANRNVATLSKSIVTRFGLQLPRITEELELDAIVSPLTTRVDVVVNTYPYQLSKAEQDQLGLMLLNYSSPGTKIIIEYFKYSELSPVFMRENYLQFYLYDLQEWTNNFIFEGMTDEQIAKVKAPTLQVFAPAIANNGLLDYSKFQMPAYGNYDPFDMIKLALVEYFAYHPMDSNMGSIYTPMPKAEEQPAPKMFSPFDKQNDPA